MIQSAMFCYSYIITDYSTSTPYIYMQIFNAPKVPSVLRANFNASMGFMPIENIRANNITSYPIQLHLQYDHSC